MSECSNGVKAVLGAASAEARRRELGWDGDYAQSDLESGITEIKAALEAVARQIPECKTCTAYDGCPFKRQGCYGYIKKEPGT